MGRRRLWSRRKHESEKAYEAFSIYIELGEERSLSRVARRLKKSAPLMKKWSDRHDWRARALVYDNYLADLKRTKTEEEVLKFIENQARLSRGFRERALRKLETMTEDDLEPADAVKFAEVGVKLGRQVLGLDEPPKTEGQVIIAQDGAKVQVNTFTIETHAELLADALEDEEPDVRERVLTRFEQALVRRQRPALGQGDNRGAGG
jgi:hypothetical protein